MNTVHFDVKILDTKSARERILNMEYPDWVKLAHNKYGLGGRKAYAIFKEAEKIQARALGDTNNALVRKGVVRLVEDMATVA